MRRREFITLLGGAAATWPLVARAQQPAMPVIGFLSSASAAGWLPYESGFHRGLSETGYIEGKNVAIEYRWADGDYDRLPALAADLVARKVAVIVSTGGNVATFAAKAATSTIPIVFTFGSDPVAAGVVASMNRPGGNLTGVSHMTVALAAKRTEIAVELSPKAHVLTLLVNPNHPDAAAEAKEVQAAAQAQGRVLNVLNASQENDFESVFAEIVKRGTDVLFVSPDPFFNSRRDKLIALAARHAIPTMYAWREYVVAGGLISYGSNLVDQYRLTGVYTGRVLKGIKPAELPIQQPIKFELVVNLKTAKALGLTISREMQLRADEVIE
jgi:putative ABC transport system substrate-binding protein